MTRPATDAERWDHDPDLLKHEPRTSDGWMRDGDYWKQESMREVVSEQAEGYPERHPDAVSPISSDIDRARLLVSIMRRARQFVGEGGGPDLPSQLDFILSSARKGNLPALLYEIIWKLRGFFREHVIINDVT
jgi:hypothetical protein